MKVTIIGVGIVGRGVYEIIREELTLDIEAKCVVALRP